MTRTTWPARACTIALLLAQTSAVGAQRGPAPTSTNLPAEVLSVACSPQIAFEMPDRSLRVTGGQDSSIRRVWAPGDLITINGGIDNGIEVGQLYYIRRIQVENNQKVTRATPANVATVGWLKVWALSEIDRQLSLATIEHACDSIEVNDYLEPFVLPTVVTPTAEILKPQHGNYGRILFGTDYRKSFGKRDYFIVNRGSDHGVAPGDRFVVYRDKRVSQNFLYYLGEAVAIDVKPNTATLQVLESRDAFLEGDYVAPRRAPRTDPQ